MKAILTNLVAGACGALMVLAVQAALNVPSHGGSETGKMTVDCLRAKRIEVVDDEGTIRASLECRTGLDKSSGQHVFFSFGGQYPQNPCAVWMHSCKFGRNVMFYYDPAETYHEFKLVFCAKDQE
jgi:hypothetical protein